MAIETISNQKRVFSAIENLTGQAHILTTPQLFLKAFNGNHAKALFFSQILYWCDKSKRQDGWFYKSYKEWEEELFLTPYQIRKFTKELHIEGLINTKTKKANGVPTIHYFVNQEALKPWIVKIFNNGLRNNLIMESENISQSITEITTESTEKNNKGFYSDESKTIAFSFLDYRKKCLEEAINPDIILAVEYYLTAYKEYMGQVHPNLKPQQWQQVIDNILVGRSRYNDFDLDLGNLEDIIDKHFVTEYYNCDFNILHFISGEITANRYYEECYR